MLSRSTRNNCKKRHGRGPNCLRIDKDGSADELELVASLLAALLSDEKAQGASLRCKLAKQEDGKWISSAMLSAMLSVF